MSYTLNISFILPEGSVNNFIVWFNNHPVMSGFTLYRLIGSKEGSVTYCGQLELNSIIDLQHKTGFLNGNLQAALRKDFSEDIVFYVSALEKQ